MGKVSKSLKIRIMNQKKVLEFDGFRVERESFLGGDCYGVVTSCKKDEKGVSYHLEVEFDTSTAKFHFSKCYAHEVLALSILSITLWANRIYHVYG